jgi:hypothetical protein
VKVPYDQSEVASFKIALDPLGKEMAASLGGPRTDQVVALLNSHLRVDISNTLKLLIDAVQDPKNADSIRAAEEFWEQFPDPPVAPTVTAAAANAAPPVSSTTAAAQAAVVSSASANESRIQHGTQLNNTAIYLAYITTFGFFPSGVLPHWF